MEFRLSGEKILQAFLFFFFVEPAIKAVCKPLLMLQWLGF